MTSRDDEPPRHRDRRIDEDGDGHEQLVAEIDRYVRSGYRVASETATSVSLVKPKRFGCLPFVVLFLLGIFPAVIYVAWYASRRDKTVYLRLEDGRVRRGGGRGVAGEAFSVVGSALGRLWDAVPPAARPAVAAVPFVAGALVVVILLLRGGDGGVRPLPVATPSAGTQTPTRAAAASPTAPATATPTPTPAPETYTVVAGDTLSRIATRFGIGLAELAELNEITDPSRIEVGTVLVLPGATAELSQEPLSRVMAPSRRIITNTGGTGVSHRDACADDARTGEPSLPDGAEVALRERGIGRCDGWFVVRLDDRVSWVRDRYLGVPPPPPPTPVPLTAPLILEPGNGCRITASRRYITYEGQVTNNTSQPMRRVVAVTTYTTEDGTFITSDDALIDFDPLLPDQTSPFSVITRYNPAIAWCSVQFKELLGGTIRDQPRNP